MFKNKFLSFLIFGFVTFSASFIGSIATITSKEPWYSTLNKSGLNPPDWVFAPVWTTLYLFMTIAIWSAWHKNYKDLNLIYIYLMHLFFNTTWSIVFFVFHNIFAALINLLIIISFIIVLMIKYYKISNLSFILMIPYLLWCIYALTLNISLYILN
tara:strand:- start:496 stop:963 length:468 start_codon:yes stop_codon:yes gene_type:complete